MASIPITIQGVMFYTGLDIGGGPMPGGPGPSHPIAPGGPPPGYWGGVAPPYPDQGLPGQPPGIWPSPGHPSHPIAPGGPPPGIWPSPGHPSHPIAPGGQPGVPTHPIVIPPDAIAPGVPSHPIYWPIEPTHPIAPGGQPGSPPTPTHPIVIPGDDPDKPKFEVKAAWSPQTGWIVVVVPGEGATVPTPSTPPSSSKPAGTP